jgi:glutamate/tyrosine decarboxylase-like PLP-dependent enzyme
MTDIGTSRATNRLPAGSPVGGGPAAADQLGTYLAAAVDEIARWMDEYGPYISHPTLDVEESALLTAFDELCMRLHDNYPFFHPRYIGQMLKPPHPAAIIGYVATMLINPNNHALDGGPATATMEREVVTQLATMFGHTNHLGHLTSSGTIANLEALFVARESRPEKGVAFSADAHYTHGRMCQVLGVQGHSVRTDAAGRLDLEALESLLRSGSVGTVVLTAGTTGLGALDPIDEAVPLCAHYGVRTHVDAAYGGFFSLIADDAVDGVRAAPFKAIAECDSVVVDPHKHGLQPYGCGAVIFQDPAVARFYRHDSPYTYFTSDELHLGEISLECSRSGAAAAALWLTLQVLPLTAEGLGAALRPGRRAALAWTTLLEESEQLAVYQQPELDIVTYLPRRATLSEVDRVSAYVLDAGMALPSEQAVFVATYDVTGAALAARGHSVSADVGHGRIMRSVLMKPESEDHLPALHTQLETLTSDAG